jgi:hypothetical protein
MIREESSGINLREYVLKSWWCTGTKHTPDRSEHLLCGVKMAQEKARLMPAILQHCCNLPRYWFRTVMAIRNEKTNWRATKGEMFEHVHVSLPFSDAFREIDIAACILDSTCE